MGNIAVIDTETNWYDDVMSIGIAIADAGSFHLVDSKYYILDPAYLVGGMYESVIDTGDGQQSILCSRQEAIADIRAWLQRRAVQKLFAYNAPFDCRHLPELRKFQWYDIMRIAAYRQYNPYIPAGTPCCSTGRMKSQYGVEAITRMITGNSGFSEIHNALYDAIDELNIMRALGIAVSQYEPARI